jgi:cytochrome c oxidase assembly factor CtaG
MRFLRSPLVRGLAGIAVLSAVIVALSLEESVVTARALLGIAFFLAIAFFLFLLWRERRSDIDTWPERARWTFYGAIVLAVADIGVYLGVGANGPEAIAFLAVLAACGWAVWRTWRDQHHYS